MPAGTPGTIPKADLAFVCIQPFQNDLITPDTDLHGIPAGVQIDLMEGSPGDRY
jgi:hypothetical protein